MALPQPLAEGDDHTIISVYCPKCGELIGTISIDKTTRGRYQLNSNINGIWAWIWNWISNLLWNADYTYPDAEAAAEAMKERMIKEHLERECKNPAPLGEGIPTLILCLAGYAVYTVRKRKEIA